MNTPYYDPGANWSLIPSHMHEGGLNGPEVAS